MGGQANSFLKVTLLRNDENDLDGLFLMFQ